MDSLKVNYISLASELMMLELKKINWNHLSRYYGKVETNYGSGYVYDLVLDFDNTISASLYDYFNKTSPTFINLDTIYISLEKLRKYLIENEIIILQMQRVINKLLFLKKRKHFQFHGVSLYPSEIHVMIVVDEACASNATKIAQTLGVTKGAVSQTLSRLEKKGVLFKTKDPYHKNELELTFTKLGVKALKYYKKQAEELFRQHERYLSRLSQKEKLIIHRFMSHMEALVNDIA